MTDRQKSLIVNVTIAVFSVAAGFYIASVLQSADDDDRPPIVVKNGSLYFDNGYPQRPGSQWNQVPGTSDWQPDHPKGKPVTQLQLYFNGGTGTCVETAVKSFTVNFDPDGSGSGPAKQYTVSISTAGKAVPTVNGDLQRDPGNLSRLIGGTEGEIISVVGVSFQCDNPTSVWVESVK